jgi:hypothetical protein
LHNPEPFLGIAITQRRIGYKELSKNYVSSKKSLLHILQLIICRGERLLCYINVKLN